MGKRYKKSPLVEALCEFQFDQDSVWDFTLPGLIYENLKEIFPQRQQLQIATTSPSEMTPLIRFLDNDGKALVQIGQRFLTINCVKPYPSWEEFLPLIKRGFIAYSDAANPKKVRHVGLRFINRIEILESGINIENYFKVRPYITPELPSNLGAFFVGVDIPYEEAGEVLRIQLINTDPDVPNTIAVILEISYLFAQLDVIPLASLFEKINIAHTRIEQAFEACITDELRQLFEEEKG